MSILISRKIWLTENLLFRRFHEINLICPLFGNKIPWSHCGNYGNSLSRFYGKNFVKITFLLNKLLKNWFHEIFFRWERIFRFSTLCWSRSHSNFYLECDSASKMQILRTFDLVNTTNFVISTLLLSQSRFHVKSIWYENGLDVSRKIHLTWPHFWNHW